MLFSNKKINFFKMTLRKVCLIMTLLSLAFAQHCEVLNDQALLFPTVNEKMKWSIPKELMTGLDMTYSLPNQQIFGIKNSIYEVDNGIIFKQSASIVDIDAYKQAVNGAWLNGFTLLDVKKDQSFILWAQGTVINTHESPKFNTVTPVFPTKPGYTCFTLSFIDQNSVLVDCADTSTAELTNYFYIVYKDSLQTPKEIQNDNVQNLKSATTSKRLMQQRIIINNDTGKTTKYFFRGTPSYASPDTLGNSLIEIYALDSSNNPYKINSYLDSATLAVLASIHDPGFSFDLVDLQIDGDGHIFVLDAFNGLFILEWTADGIWTLVAHIPSRGGKAFAMSQNMLITLYGDFIHHVTVLYYNYFVLYEISDDGSYTEKRVYDLQFSIADFTDRFFIGINQQKILVQSDQTLYLYTLGSVDLVMKLPVIKEIQKIIMNPYEPNFITFNSQAAETYQVSDSYLELLPSASAIARNQMILTGTSHLGTKTADCSVTIQYQVLSADDTTVYNVKPNDYTPIPSLLVYPQKSFYELTDWVAGPIITFSEQPKQQIAGEQSFLEVQDDPVPPPDVTIQSIEQIALTLTATNFPDASKVVFADMQKKFIFIIESLTKPSDPNLFYLFLQTMDLKITLWTCETEDTLIPTSRLNCHDPYDLGISSLTLSKETYQNWFFFDQITFAFLKDNYILEAYTTDDGKPPVKSFDITFQSDQLNTINSFTFVKNLLYIVQSGLKTIKIYQTLMPFPLMLTIDASMIYAEGYTGEWKPKRVFGNKILKPTLIFIDNGLNMILADYHDGELTLLSQVDYVQANPDARVSIGSKSFFVAEVGSDGSQISEYDYQDINNILLMKKVSLYNKFTISSPLQSDFSDDNGYFYIKTLLDGKTAILVIQPGEMQHNSLFSYLQMPTTSSISTTAAAGSTIFALGGDDTMYIYLNEGGKHQIFQLFKTQRLAIIPSPKANQFVTEVTIRLQAQSIGGGAPLKFQDQKMTVLNTMSNVELDPNAFNANLNLKVSKKEEIIQLDDSWFTGQVGWFEIDCDACGTNIFMTNKVNATKALIGDRNVIDVAALPIYQQQVIQTDDALFFLSSDFSFAQAPVFLTIDSDEFQCYKVATHEEGSYIVSICSLSGRTVAYFTSCVALSSCFPLTLFLELEGVGLVTQVQLIQNTLFLLDSSNTLQAFSIDLTADVWTATKALTIDTTSLQAAKTVKINDFQIVTVYKDPDTIYKVFFTDETNGIWIVDLQIAKGVVTMLPKTTNWGLVEWLSSVKQYTDDSTIYLSVRLYDGPTLDKDTLTVSLLFTTNNVAHYGAKLTFDFKSATAGSILTDKTLLYIINRYGNWDAKVGLSVSGSYFAVPYQDSEASFLAVYKMQLFNISQLISIPAPVPPKNLKDDPATPQLLTFVGGQSLTPGTSFSLMATVSDQAKSLTADPVPDPTPVLFVGSASGATGFNVNEKIGLNVINGESVKDQKIKITASNDFTSATGTTDLKGYSGSSSSSSSKWWIWVLIVVGVLVVLGVGYYCYKSKNQNKEEPLIVNQGN